MYKKIIPVFVSIAMLWGLFSFSAAANGVERSQTTTGFGSYLLNLFTSWQKENPDAPPSKYDGFGRGGGFESSYMGSWRSDTAACPSSEAPGGYHYIDPDVPSRMSGFGSEGTDWEFCCLYCHEYFTVTGNSLSEAYKDYVATFPASGFTSSGDLLYNPLDYPELTDVDTYQGDRISLSSFPFVSGNYSYSLVSGSYSHVDLVFKSPSASDCLNRLYIYPIAPISGVYIVISQPKLTWKMMYSSGSELSFDSDVDPIDFNTIPSISGGSYNAGDELTSFHMCASNNSGRLWLPSAVYANVKYFPPIYKITPFDSLVVTNTYSINSRPTSISGNYGIIGNNGQITKIDSTTIINETNNTYTNPSTGTTSTITEWTYDYSDRSYNVLLESGDTITVTYGDEYITILEGDTTYNVYYIVEGSGGSGDNPGTDTCKHDYTSTTDRDATCTVPGQITYTCSLCGYSYTESILAKGHTWTVLQTVTTEYDQEGNLLQQGYTIYQCSVCGEQYKDEAGTGPPSSGGQAGGDSEESIWDSLGDLLGSIFGGLFSVIGAILSKILQALASLATMIAEKLAAVVELVLSFFDEIPKLFSGFLGFLTAVFPFLPEDIMLLLTFGIAVLVFIGIIKALRR